MTEKIISVKKYIEPIPETFEAIDFVPEPEEIVIKPNHHKKIKKKVKIDNSIYDDILISNLNENVKTEEIESKPLELPKIEFSRVTKINPRGIIKKKKGH